MIEQTHAERCGNHANGRQRHKFQHSSRKESVAQHLQGFVAKAVTDESDALLLRLAAAEHLQRCQPLHHIQEVGAHERKRSPLCPGALRSVATHQRHEQRDNRPGEEQQYGAEPINR